MILPSGASTTDYSRLANSRGWGSGWPACGGMAGNIVQIKLTRSSTSIVGGVHKNIAELFLLIGNEIERRGYMFHPGWCWGSECRAISGSNTPSNHSWGLAVDINSPNNPYTSSGVHDIPDWAYALFRQYGFGCGADYSGKKDWMHVEAMGTPSDMAIMTALARQNLGGGVVTPPTPPEDPSMSAAEVKQLSDQITALTNLLFTPDARGSGHEVRAEVSYATKQVQNQLSDIKQGADQQRDDIAGKIAEVHERVLYPGARWDNFQDIVVRLNLILEALKIPIPEGPVPSTPPTPAVPDSYTVQSGDTLSGIAAKYGLSKDDLAAWNNIADQNNIGIGQVLKLHP